MTSSSREERSITGPWELSPTFCGFGAAKPSTLCLGARGPAGRFFGFTAVGASAAGATGSCRRSPFLPPRPPRPVPRPLPRPFVDAGTITPSPAPGSLLSWNATRKRAGSI